MRLGPPLTDRTLRDGRQARLVRRGASRGSAPEFVEDPIVIDMTLLEELYRANSRVQVGVLERIAIHQGEHVAAAYAEELTHLIQERGQAR